MSIKESLRATEARLDQMRLRADRNRRFAEKSERARQNEITAQFRAEIKPNAV
jgi:hypothetical protein